jgi:hypothetical protein
MCLNGLAFLLKKRHQREAVQVATKSTVSPIANPIAISQI